MAIQNEERPSLMILTRQALPTLDRSVYADASGAEKGAYILKKEEGSTPDYLLIATGSEVSIALEAAQILERSEEHTSELQSRGHLVCRLLLEKENKKTKRQPE